MKGSPMLRRYDTYQRAIYRGNLSSRSAQILLSLVLLGLVAAICSGCAGQTARDEVLGPALQGIAPRVLDDAAKAPGVDRAVLERFAASVRAGNWPVALEDWPVIEQYAELGISTQLDRREIGPNGAVTLRERVRNFGEKLREQVGVPAP